MFKFVTGTVVAPHTIRPYVMNCHITLWWKSKRASTGRKWSDFNGLSFCVNYFDNSETCLDYLSHIVVLNSVLPGCYVKKNVVKPVRDFIQNEIKLGGYHVRIRSIRYMVVSVSIHMQFTITVTDDVCKSLQKRENRKGQSTDPWGTPSVTLLEQKQQPLTMVTW